MGMGCEASVLPHGNSALGSTVSSSVFAGKPSVTGSGGAHIVSLCPVPAVSAQGETGDEELDPHCLQVFLLTGVPVTPCAHSGMCPQRYRFTVPRCSRPHRGSGIPVLL